MCQSLCLSLSVSVGPSLCLSVSICLGLRVSCLSVSACICLCPSLSVFFLSVSAEKRTRHIGTSSAFHAPVSNALPHAILHWELAGCDLTVYLMKIHDHRKEGDRSWCQRENFATVLPTATQSSNRLQKVPTKSRPTCSQTKTSSLSAPNASC